MNLVNVLVIQKNAVCAVKSSGKSVETGTQNCAMLGSMAGDDAVACDLVDSGHNMNSLCLNETLDNSLDSCFYDARDSDDNPSGNSKSNEVIARESCAETSAKGSQGTSDSLRGDSRNQVLENNESESCIRLHQLQDAGANLHVNKSGCALSPSVNVKEGKADVSLSMGRNVHLHPNCFNGLPSHDLNAAPSFDCQKERSFLDCNSLECQDTAEGTLVPVKDHMVDVLDWNLPEQTLLPVKDHMLDALDLDLPEETLVPVKDHMLDALDLNLPEPENDMLLCHDENQETSSYIDAEFIQESTVTHAVGTEDETLLSTMITHSGHVCRVNLLEDLIENAKSHKVFETSSVRNFYSLLPSLSLLPLSVCVCARACVTQRRGGRCLFLFGWGLISF